MRDQQPAAVAKAQTPQRREQNPKAYYYYLKLQSIRANSQRASEN